MKKMKREKKMKHFALGVRAARYNDWASQRRVNGRPGNVATGRRCLRRRQRRIRKKGRAGAGGGGKATAESLNDPRRNFENYQTRADGVREVVPRISVTNLRRPDTSGYIYFIPLTVYHLINNLYQYILLVF